MKQSARVLIAMALLGAPAMGQTPKPKTTAQPPASAAKPPPKVADMSAAGWAYVAASETANVYMKPFGKDEIPWSRGWVRYEAKAGKRLQGGDGSSMELIEFDCTGKRTRTIQGSYYPGSAMSGTPDTITTMSAWTFTSPDTVGEALQKWACEATLTN